MNFSENHENTSLRAKNNNNSSPSEPYQDRTNTLKDIKEKEASSRTEDAQKLSELATALETNESIKEITGDVVDRCESDSPGKYIGISKAARGKIGVEPGQKVSIVVDGEAKLFTVRQATKSVVEKETSSGVFKFNMCIDYFEKLKGKNIALKKVD